MNPLQQTGGVLPASPTAGLSSSVGNAVQAAYPTPSALSSYTTPAPTPAPAAPAGLSNGLMTVRTVKQIDDEVRKNAAIAQAQPHIQSLAAYVRNCWSAAKQAKREPELRMLKSMRQRAGEYEPEKLSSIREQGGSEIYMMLTATKVRGASALLRDAVLGNGADKPWYIEPSRIPEISPERLQEAKDEATEFVTQLYAMGGQVTPEQMREAAEMMKDKLRAEMVEEAKESCALMEDKMEDQQQEGNFINALSDFLDDVATFPAAILKGPVIRRKNTLKFDEQTGEIGIGEELRMEWERVDPFNVYPAPHATDINDGFLIEHHRLTKEALTELIGVDGYDENSIRAVLQDYGRGGLREWLAIDSARAAVEEKRSSLLTADPEKLIDALQFWGAVEGKMLIEWGLKEDQVPDPAKMYWIEAWLIGTYIIKAALNTHKLGYKPYFKTSFEKIPGRFWGNAPPDLIADCQDMCNAAARALANNMGISSGPQVWVDVSRLPAGEDVTQMYPWKIWQVERDQTGATGQPMGFFQPDTHAPELMQVYERFAVLADEYSGIPRYMTGGEGTGGAGRTASGLSMMITNAGKTIKQVISNIDHDVLGPALRYQYAYNFRFSDDPDLKKGDINIVPKGAMALQVKDTAQVRRNEFLQATANPIDMQIVGLPGRAAVLREVAKNLDMDTDEIVPSPDVLKQMQRQQQMQQQMMAAQQQQQQQPPQPGGGQNLMDGKPVINNFSPAS